jgi:hypothetical protein
MPEPNEHPRPANGRANTPREGSQQKEPGADDSPKATPRHRWLMRALRYGLPVVVVIGGLVVMSFGDESQLEGGAGIVSAGLAIYFVNWLARLSVSGDREREREEAAREYYAKHGRWPR